MRGGSPVCRFWRGFWWWGGSSTRWCLPACPALTTPGSCGTWRYFWPLFLLTVGVAAGSGNRSIVRRQVIASLAVALVLPGAVLWAVVAPLPQLRSVLLPWRKTSPEQVVTTLVATLDAHDQATARALCVRGTPPCESLDDYAWVGIGHLGPLPEISGSYGPAGVKGVYVPVDRTGRTRSGERPGESGAWGYERAPVGPQRAWRIIDDGAGGATKLGRANGRISLHLAPRWRWAW